MYTTALLLIAFVPFLTSVLEDSFTCPKLTVAEAIQEPHPRYPYPTNCQKFYICLNGITPSEQSCDFGEVFNANSKQCDLLENVAECIDRYKEHLGVVAPKLNIGATSVRE